MSIDIDTSRGCLFGMAFGDALGAPTEFLSIKRILDKWPPDGPRTLTSGQRLVTDDTQMALAVGEALVNAHKKGPLSTETVEPALRSAFISWLNSPDNNRAPGNTCIEACRHLYKGAAWHNATIHQSKGCGANMRVAPVGLISEAWPGVNEQMRSRLAQFQAAMTHGYPTALAASDLTAFTVAYLAEKKNPEKLVDASRAYALRQREVYHSSWLGQLWKQAGSDTPESYIKQGWDECIGILERVEKALKARNKRKDPCLAVGAGWVAEEAYGTAVYCFLSYPDEPHTVIRRAAVTSGDSDSIACLAGAFAGAYKGTGLWPPEWFNLIEYRERLSALAEGLLM